TATLKESGGSRSIISRALSDLRNRGLGGEKLKTSMSAPRSSDFSSSAKLVMPPTLTLMFINTAPKTPFIPPVVQRVYRPGLWRASRTRRSKRHAHPVSRPGGWHQGCRCRFHIPTPRLEEPETQAALSSKDSLRRY